MNCPGLMDCPDRLIPSVMRPLVASRDGTDCLDKSRFRLASLSVGYLPVSVALEESVTHTNFRASSPWGRFRGQTSGRSLASSRCQPWTWRTDCWRRGSGSQTVHCFNEPCLELGELPWGEVCCHLAEDFEFYLRSVQFLREHCLTHPVRHVFLDVFLWNHTLDVLPQDLKQHT